METIQGVNNSLILYEPGPALLPRVLEVAAVFLLWVASRFVYLCWSLLVWFSGTSVGIWGCWVPFGIYVWVSFSLWLGSIVGVLCKVVWLVGIRNTIPGWLLEVLLAYAQRGSRALPPVLGVEDAEGTREAQPGEALWYGRSIAQGNNLRHASVAAGGLTPARIRRRARWVNSLQKYLGGRPGVIGKLIRGRWEPDLPSSERTDVANVLLSLVDSELKLLGGGAVPVKGNKGDGVYFVVETPEGREVVFPHLLGRLSRFSALRCRDSTLWTGLRTRAQEWVKSAGIREDIAALVLPTHVARSFLHSTTERLASSLVENHGYNAPELIAGA